MARRRKIDISGWRREAEAEDIERVLSYFRRQDGVPLYASTLRAAVEMRAAGRSEDDALAALRHTIDLPPKKADGRLVDWGREHLAIEQEMADITESAVKAAYAQAQRPK